MTHPNTYRALAFAIVLSPPAAEAVFGTPIDADKYPFVLVIAAILVGTAAVISEIRSSRDRYDTTGGE